MALAWVLTGAAGAFCLLEAWLQRDALLAAWPVWVCLALPALLSARIGLESGENRPVRLALSFVLAAMLVLPRPGGLLLAFCTLVGGLGGGLAGPAGRGLYRFGSVVFAALLADLVHRSTPLAPDLAPGPAVLRLALLFAVIQGFTLGLAKALEGRTEPSSGPGPSLLQRLLIESVNIPLAFLLAGLLLQGAWVPYAGISGLLLLVGYLVRELLGALGDLRRANDALAARVSELATLHAIGREILSSLEPSRVFSIIERQCRKILDVDLFCIALSERDSTDLQMAYRRQRGKRAEEEPYPLQDGLASWVVTEKRALRVDDFLHHPPSVPQPVNMVPPGLRAALVVPLIVEDRVIGVLSVQSRRPMAYDDHQLAVLTTIAQQAAVAIENARHYEMATVDSLTGLFLRDYFFRRLEEEHRRLNRYGGNSAVLMIDLDGFKAINDKYGHLAGDRYLSAVGDAIRARLRGADLACRYGGDEFCLLLPETELTGARTIAERLRVAISRLAVEAHGRLLHGTASIGVATFRDHESSNVHALLRKADQALYLAKRGGRDRVVPYAARARAGRPRSRGERLAHL